MKKNRFSFGKMVAATLVIAAFTCSIALAYPGKDKAQKAATAAKSAQQVVSTMPVSEETQLVQHLENDGLISQVKGFILEKSQNRLFINGVQLPASVASKYTATLKQDEIRVEVHSFMERLQQHPDASLMQLILPVSMSSPCVDNKPKKPGC